MSEPASDPTALPIASEGHRHRFTCLNCGRENDGDFCGQCGQKNLHAGDLSLRHVWHDIVHELVHVDGKILGTLGLLLKKPGQLTLDFLEGRRARHIHPLRLFLVIGAVYFLFAQSISAPLDLRTAFALNPNDRRILERIFANTGMTVDEFVAQANAGVTALFKSVYISAVLLNGVWLWLLFRRKYACLAEHLVLALHLACFLMVWWIAVMSPAHFFGVSRKTTGVIATLVSLGYFLLAGRRVYGASWLRLGATWLILLVSQGLILGASMVVVTRQVLVRAPFSVSVRAAVESDATGAVIPQGRLLLFDGHSLEGWIFVGPQVVSDVRSVWSVVDGEIRCTGMPQGYLRTRTRYRDYTLRFEWRWTGTPGNSGVFVHTSGKDQIWPLCLEVQLRSGEAGSLRTNGGALVREVRPPAPNPRQVTRRVAGTEKPVGEWNRAEVVCRGDRVTISINGVLQNEITGATLTEGAIALQSEGAPTAFRNIELSPLP